MTPSADERSAIQRKHVEGMRAMDGVPVCVWDRRLWPCDTEKIRAALVAAEAQRDAAEAKAAEWEATAENWRAVNRRNVDAVDAAEADAKALAEALAEALEGYAYLDKTLTASGGNRAVDGRVAALSAHRERTAR